MQHLTYLGQKILNALKKRKYKIYDVYNGVLLNRVLVLTKYKIGKNIKL